MITTKLKKRKESSRALRLCLEMVFWKLSWFLFPKKTKIHNFIKTFCFCRDTISKESAASVPGWVQDFLYLTAVLNSCINPVVYGHYYHGERKGRHRDSTGPVRGTVVSEVMDRQDGDRRIRMKRLQWNREARVRITINNNSSDIIWV